jgi:hypothetical protein
MRRPALLWCCCLGLVLSGCAGYRLGPTNGVPAGSRSVQINLFVNQTDEPRLVEAVTSALRKTLQQDGTYRLNTSNQGDIVVTGTIVRYDRSQLSFQTTDILTPRDYRVSLTAQILARERLTGKVLLDRAVSGQTTVRLSADQTNAERQAVPLLADDLAKNATSLLVDGEW